MRGEYILLDCNERYCQMAGRSKEELLSIDKHRHLATQHGKMKGKNRIEYRS